MSLSSPYKPSPLSYGSPRTSPFRRPGSPSSPSTTIRPSTPTHTSTRPQTPSKLQNAITPQADEASEPITATWTPSTQNLLSLKPRDPPSSPTRTGRSPSPAVMASSTTIETPRSPSHDANGIFSSTVAALSRQPITNKASSADALAKLPLAQVRSMREAFQLLNRDNNGQVNREDVSDMLTNLGLDATPQSLAPYFPPSQPSTLSLPSYLSTLSNLLSPLSPPSELLAAFAAFDDDDSGQIDSAELRDALLHTAPEPGERVLSAREVEMVMSGFVARREFGSRVKGTGKGDVFRYREFVGGLGGGGLEGKGEGESVEGR